MDHEELIQVSNLFKVHPLSDSTDASRRSRRCIREPSSDFQMIGSICALAHPYSGEVNPVNIVSRFQPWFHNMTLVSAKKHLQRRIGRR